MTSRWLWVTPRISSTLATGALRYSHDLAAAIAAEGNSVTMLGVIAPDDPLPTATPAGVTYEGVVGEFRPRWRSMLSALPNQASACRVQSFVTRVRTSLASGEWDVIVVDGLQVGWMEAELRRSDSGATRLFVTHNHETSMRRGIANSQPWTTPRRLLLELEARKTARLERRVLDVVNVVSSITTVDHDRFERDAPAKVHVVAAPGWSGSEPDDPVPLADRPRRIGIMGSFEWHAKQTSLRSFLTAADPVLAGAGVELVVGGRMPESFRREIEPSLRATTIVGWVDEPEAFLSTCRMGVVAESLGGGFKLKALDYIFHHVPVAALAHSASGLQLADGGSIILADDERTLAERIVDIVDDVDRLATIASNAHRQAARRFSWPLSARRLIEATGDHGR